MRREVNFFRDTRQGQEIRLATTLCHAKGSKAREAKQKESKRSGGISDVPCGIYGNTRGKEKGKGKRKGNGNAVVAYQMYHVASIVIPEGKLKNLSIDISLHALP